MKNPKIGILSPIDRALPPIGYGPWELIVYNLSQELVKLNVDVTVFTVKKSLISAQKQHSFFKPLQEMPPEDVAAANAIHITEALKTAKELHLDLLHNHLSFEPILFNQLAKNRMVSTLHGSACEPRRKLYLELLKDEMYFSISNKERDFAPQLNYIDTVYNGIDFDLYDTRKGEGKYLVFSGRVVKDKGILSAIKISQKSKIPLRIAGIITDQEFFDTQVKPHVDGKLITFMGNMTQKKLNSLLTEAIAFLCMLEWEEPFGLSPLDALASGVPVIATPRGAMPEMLYDPGMGVLVNSVDEALEKIDEVRKFDPLACRQLAKKKFSSAVMAKDYLENYIKILSA